MCYGQETHGFTQGKNFSQFRGDMSKIAHRFMGHFSECMERFEGWVPHSVEEFEDYYILNVPLPGFSKDNVKVTLIDNEINIEATRKPEENTDKKVESKNESAQPFARIFPNFMSNNVNTSFPLPSNINQEAIKSKMDNGLLKIKIGKNPPKNININSEENIS